jgi:ribosomal protein S18 acetylase RimI-like enzyme
VARDRVALEPEGPGHLAFLRELYASTREDELRRAPWTDEQKRAFLASQFEAQHAYYHQQWPDASYLVVTVDGELAGRLYVHRRPEEIELVDVALLPRHRGCGIGADLVRELQDEARSAAVPLRLYVEHENPARRLYDRLGFRPVGDTGVYVHMEWRAESRAGARDVS